MFPSECVLERRVRSAGDDDLAYTNLPLFILECKDRKAVGYADEKLEIYNQMLQGMKIGVRLADAPPAVSYLVILGSDPSAEIVSVDKAVIVINLDFPEEAGLSYLIYDAVALSLRMIPAPEPEEFHRFSPLSSSVSVARPCRGTDYALVSTGRLDASGEGDFLLLWRPSSSSTPWSEYKEARLPDCIDWTNNKTNTEFSFDGHAYWVDLLCGVSYCSRDTLFDDDDSSVAMFGDYIPLPVPPGGHDLWISKPAAYRTMGVVRDSFIRFVSIDGFQDHVELEKRTVTVWRLLELEPHQDEPWELEHEFSLKELWEFEGFGNLPKDLTPMYPLLSTKDTDVIYLVLGEYTENLPDAFTFEREFSTSRPRYLLAVDMRNKIVRTFEPQNYEEDWFDALISCRFSRRLRKALVGPCDDEGIPIPIPTKKPSKNKRRRDGGNNVAEEARIPMKKKKPRLEKRMCCWCRKPT